MNFVDIRTVLKIFCCMNIKYVHVHAYNKKRKRNKKHIDIITSEYHINHIFIDFQKRTHQVISNLKHYDFKCIKLQH